MQTKQVTALSLIFGIILFAFIPMVENNECEEKGQYRAANGFCCQLCSAGSRWVGDCYSSGGHSFCSSCSLGRTYMDVANHYLDCKTCNTCNSRYENIQHSCNLTSDTVCECEDGYSRLDPSQPCEVTASTGQTITIPVGVVISIVLVVVVVVVAAAVGIMIYLKKKHQYPFGVPDNVPLLSEEAPAHSLETLRMLINERMQLNGAEVWQQLNANLPEVCKSVSENSLFILNKLFREERIEMPKYWEGYDMTDNSARAIYLLLHVVNMGEEMCRWLLNTIHAGEHKPRQLQTLLESAAKCSPALNPVTAHDELIISEDYKKAIWINDPQEKPDNPDRFDYWVQVLSFEYFENGCHCWVVNVEDLTKFRVGVAYGIMPRKGQGSECLMGFNSMSWCLRKFKNKYTAWHEKQRTALDVGEHPRRIGVALDYDAGLLLFYNADNNTHLHTFYAHFCHPLHVALWLWDGALTIEPIYND